MQITSQFTRAILMAFCLIGFAGCGGDTATTATTDTADSHADHDDHDGEGHDSHDEGDHEGHDHDGDGHDDHDHGDAKQIDASAVGLSADDLVSLDEKPLPENYNAAVAELATLSKKIADAIESGDIKDDHGPLHDVSGLLDGIATLAEKSSMDDNAKKAVGAAVENLLDAYGDVDYRLHDAKKGKDYSDVADEIGAALKTLQGYAK